MTSLLHRLRRTAGLALAGLAAAFGLATAAPAAAEPAIWVVKDEDSTIYLFGTVHLLRPDSQWKSPKIAKAMAEAQDLTLEVADINPDPASMMPLMQKYGLDLSHPLSGKLTPEDNARLAKVAALYGMSPAQLEPLRPWLASVTLGMMPIIKAGYDPNAGVERILKAEADARGEPVAGFETMDQQFSYFASMPLDIEVEYLRQTLDQHDRMVGQIDELAKAWEAGDVDALAAIMSGEMRKDSPKLYEVLLVKRNEDFARQIKDKLAGKGVSFVAVGAGHLAGPDSVQEQLKKLGIKAERF